MKDYLDCLHAGWHGAHYYAVYQTPETYEYYLDGNPSLVNFIVEIDGKPRKIRKTKMTHYDGATYYICVNGVRIYLNTSRYRITPEFHFSTNWLKKV